MALNTTQVEQVLPEWYTQYAKDVLSKATALRHSRTPLMARHELLASSLSKSRRSAAFSHRWVRISPIFNLRFKAFRKALVLSMRRALPSSI